MYEKIFDGWIRPPTLIKTPETAKPSPLQSKGDSISVNFYNISCLKHWSTRINAEIEINNKQKQKVSNKIYFSR